MTAFSLSDRSRCAKALAILFSLCALVVGTKAAQAERRVALVIGNAAYRHATPLRTPGADAHNVTALLRRLDFIVDELTDVDKIGMEQALRRFSAAIEGADVALFYYSGHAAEVGSINYLVPVSARIDGERSLVLDTIALQDISSSMRQAGAKVQLLFLDACRDNPFESAFVPARTGGVARGLAPVTPTSGALIAFSTTPGQVARDGTGDMSPFTSGFVRYAGTPNLDVRQVLSRVRSYVLADTNDEQLPWDDSSLIGDIFLVPKRPPPKFEKITLVEMVADPSPQPLHLAAPIQPEGGGLTVKIEQGPTQGRLVLDSRTITEGDTLTPLDFKSLTYQSTALSRTDTFSYRVEDAWGNSGLGIVEIKPKAAGTDAVAPARPSVENVTLDIKAVGVSLIGLGPNLTYLQPPSLASHDERRGVQLAMDIPLGQITLGERVIEKGRSLDLADIPNLKFKPLVGAQGKHLDAVFTTADGSPGKVTVQIDVKITDCDRLAGDRLDAQGVGEGVLTGRIDVSAALPACELAHKAKPNSARFTYELGRVYDAMGRHDDAVAAYQHAASLGYVRATFRLGYQLEYVPPLDPAEGKTMLEQASAAGDVFATHTLGQMYYEGRGVSKDLDKARGLFEIAARMGHTYSMNSLGRMYQLGETVPVDLALARRYWEESAKRGDIYGIDNLGFVYLDGVAAPKDPVKALAYFKQAASLGHPEAPRNIGILYFTGNGVPTDLAEARKWYLIGADRGDAWAAYNVGEMSRLGKGGPIDNAEAAYFYARAAGSTNRLEASTLARAELGKLDRQYKLKALQRLLREIDPTSAYASDGEAIGLAQRAIASKKLTVNDSSFDALLSATAQALWLGHNIRADLF